MQKKLILSTLGKIMIILGLSMLIPLAVSVIYRESLAFVFLVVAPLTGGVGFLLYYCFKTEDRMRPKDGFAVVTYGWLIASVFGALPYLFSGALPHFADAFFETMSGFTTTGSSVIDNIEILPKGLLLWRSLTQWLGGVGIIVLFVALLSTLGISGMQIFKAEMTGPIAEKIRPRASDSAKNIWLIYIALTLIQTILLALCGMDWFDAVNHALATTSTGGFSTKNSSLGYFDNALIEWITIIFMLLCGVNFSVHYQVLKQKSLAIFFKTKVTRIYLIIIAAATIFIVVDMLSETTNGLDETIRCAAFQVVSVITSTGFITDDYDQWPHLAMATIIFLMFIGGCAGSTSGGMKVDRWVILFGQARHELQRTLHPRMVTRLKVNDLPISDHVIINVAIFFFLYIFICIISTLFIASCGIDFFSAFTAVAASLGNVGPALGAFGPTESFAQAPVLAKYLFAFLMLLGRLEIFTVLVIVLPQFHFNRHEHRQKH